MRQDSLRRDMRAIEGMPFVIVIAVVVGAATVGLLVPMLDELDEPDETTLTATVQPHPVILDNETETVEISVQTTDGETATDTTLVISEGSLPIPDGPVLVEAGPDSNELSLDIGKQPAATTTVSFRDTQNRGTVQIRIRPPPEADDWSVSEEPEITVIDPN